MIAKDDKDMASLLLYNEKSNKLESLSLTTSINIINQTVNKVNTIKMFPLSSTKQLTNEEYKNFLLNLCWLLFQDYKQSVNQQEKFASKEALEISSIENIEQLLQYIRERGQPASIVGGLPQILGDSSSGLKMEKTISTGSLIDSSIGPLKVPDNMLSGDIPRPLTTPTFNSQQRLSLIHI